MNIKAKGIVIAIINATASNRPNSGIDGIVMVVPLVGAGVVVLVGSIVGVGSMVGSGVGVVELVGSGVGVVVLVGSGDAVTVGSGVGVAVGDSVGVAVGCADTNGTKAKSKK